MRNSPVISRFANFLTSTGRIIDAALMPKRCVFCGTRSLPNDASICGACYADLPWAAGQTSIPPLVCAVAKLEYTFPVDAAIKAMKFNRRLDYVPAFADLLLESMACLPDDIDALVPVPLHWRRQATRGFNQAEELCMPLARHTGLPMLSNVKRMRATPYQSALDAGHRLSNLQLAFAVQGEISAQHVLIVDDVMTTGETCGQLAHTLLENGAQCVSALAIAQA
jgi:ComF family protein